MSSGYTQLNLAELKFTLSIFNSKSYALDCLTTLFLEYALENPKQFTTNKSKNIEFKIFKAPLFKLIPSFPKFLK